MPVPYLIVPAPELSNSSTPGAVREQLARILASPTFQRSRRLSRFLTYAVTETLAGRESQLSEPALAAEVFDRGAEFDPRTDPVVRVEASRLRARLAEYYENEGASDPLLIEVDAGGYVPRFRRREPPPPGHTSAKGPQPFRKLVALDLLRQAARHLDTGTPDALVRSLDLFERAALANPGQERAHLGIAGASIGLSASLFEPPLTALSRARVAVERALQLNPASPEAHNIMGALLALQEFDVNGANEHFQVALRLRPKFLNARMSRAVLYLGPRGFLTEALAELSQLHERVPSQIRYAHHLGMLSYLNRDYPAAIRAMRETLAISEAYLPAWFFLAWCYEHLGDQARADEILLGEKLLSVFPMAPLRQEALRLHKEGRTAEARRVALRMESSYTPGTIDPMSLAGVFAALGDNHKAFQWLDRAHEDRRFLLLYLRSDPAQDTLRPDPRFPQLLARLGL